MERVLQLAVSGPCSSHRAAQEVEPLTPNNREMTSWSSSNSNLGILKIDEPISLFNQPHRYRIECNGPEQNKIKYYRVEQNRAEHSRIVETEYNR